MLLDPDTRKSLVASVFGSLVAIGVLTGAEAIVGATHRAVDIALLALLVVALVVVAALAHALRLARRTAARLASETELDPLRRWTNLESVTGLKEFAEQLAGSAQHPREALDTINVSLDFMGHGASKWSEQTEQMRDMLLRISDHGRSGCARMLVLDPTSPVCRDTSQARFGDQDRLPRKVVTSLLRLQQLTTEHENLEIRLYAHRPAFRITIIDHRHAVVGHYRNYQDGSEATPLLVIDAEPRWSFCSPFAILFEHEWMRAESVPWERIQREAERLGCYVS